MVKPANRRWLVVAALLSALSACSTKGPRPPAPPAAWIEQFEVAARQPAFGGARFGQVGAYEVVAGVATVRVDPYHEANRRIADLRLATEDDGSVRYRTDVVILRPVDPGRASRVLLVEPPNRGRKLALAALNDGAPQTETSADSGHGWVMRAGHTMAWVGWQGDVTSGARGEVVGARLPVLGSERSPVTGRVMEEFVFDTTDNASRGGLTYPAATPDQFRATLRVRERPGAEATVLPDEAWRYVSDREIEINRQPGFDGGAIYQFTYEARDPMVSGLGMAAMRDVVSYLRAAGAEAGGQPHPLADIPPTLTVAVGVGQSGRFMRDFFWQGFNAAVEGGRVFDAAMVVGAGALKSYTNARWARPNLYSRQHEGHLVPGDQFPFTYGVTVDPISTRKDGIFARCLADDTCPKTMHADSSVDYWQARASLITTDGQGRDVELPETVRAYLLASTQPLPAARPEAGVCQQLNNPGQNSAVMRGLLVRLIEWTRDGRPPPPSNAPSIANGMLVPPNRDAMEFPDLSGPGLKFPASVNELTVVDYAAVPPKADLFRPYKLMVPRTDKDGNDVGGIRQPDIVVPLGTYTGWNLRKEGFAGGQLCGINGTFLPVAADATGRLTANDPRASIAERYPTRLHYIQRLQAAAEWLKAEGLILDEDVGRWVDWARVQAQAMRLPR
jgi:Alpha/beta hydrolase domain